MSYSSTVKHYGTIKMMELLLLATPWMNLKYVLLCEWSQTEEAAYFTILLVWHFGKSIGMENRSVVARVGGKDGGWIKWVHKEILKEMEPSFIPPVWGINDSMHFSKSIEMCITNVNNSVSKYIFEKTIRMPRDPRMGYRWAKKS